VIHTDEDEATDESAAEIENERAAVIKAYLTAVSYTHLTLPTILRV